MLKECFDFDAIKKLFARKDFTFCYDALNGAQGPYAKKVQLYCIGLMVETMDSLNHENVDGDCVQFCTCACSSVLVCCGIVSHLHARTC